jgi:hypothetical protein
MEDDLSTSTQPISHRYVDDDHEFVSKTIRFVFAPADYTRIDSTDPSDIHTQWIKSIQSAVGDDIKFFNNHNRLVTNIDTAANTHKANSHSSQFKLYTKHLSTPNTTGPNKSIITVIHRILTRIPLGKNKQHLPAYQLLVNNNCFLHEHKWDEQEWDIQQVGFVTGFKTQVLFSRKSDNAFSQQTLQSHATSKSPKVSTCSKNSPNHLSRSHAIYTRICN